jgi:predicted dehydrogenase
MNRRKFIIDLGAGAAGVALAGCSSMPMRHARRSISANEKLNIGMIGTANRAKEDLFGVKGENIVALCDVDENYLATAAKEFPMAATYTDFRRLLEQPDIDAVVVATPDHTHAVAAVAALKSGRHVYCEKPLARTISEVRIITDTARKMNAVTQIGTQIHAGRNYRNVVEIVQSGLIGEVKEVHVWVNVTYGGKKRPTETPPVPKGLNYDLWLGPTDPWPYSPEWCPFKWRNWWHFGGGALGDFGCHYMDLPFWALGLKYPLSAEAEGPPLDPDSTPPWLIVRYQFPALKAGGQPLPLTWYHGGRQPSPDILAPDLANRWKSGVLFIGDKGRLISDYSRYDLSPKPDKIETTIKIPDSIGHHKEWIQACKTGGPTSCSFDYSGPLTEAALLGNVAFRAGQKLEWDAKRLKATNTRVADQYIQHRYRSGWSI